MKTSSALLMIVACAATATTTSAQEFTNAEKALWIDRHNYFRMTALPFAAANMLKIKWSDDLAGQAIAEAKGCAAVTGAGINAHTHSDGSATTSIIDAAFQEWVVTAAIKALPNVPAPKVDGEAVGTNVYSSYSQVVWAATNQVGCGFATCATGKLVVCKYTTPGNTAGQPWYIHGSPNTQCPSGTEGKQGLCIVPGDAGNNDIAAIPAGQNAYNVFASFIGTMQKVLKGETVNAGPMTGTTSSTNPGSTAAASSIGGPMTGTSASTNPQSIAAVSTTTAPTSESTDTAATSGSAAAAATSGGASTTTTGGSVTDGEGTAAKSIGFGSLTSGSEGSPGTVRVGSNSGSTFTNEAKSSGTSSTTTAAAAASTPQNTESTSDTIGGSGTANAKSSSDSDDENHFSAAGMAGVIVVGCVMVAGIAVFVSYRKNQRRQRDIMQNGGIHIL